MTTKEYTVWNPSPKNKTSIYCKCPVKVPAAIEPTMCASCFKLLPKRKRP